MPVFEGNLSDAIRRNAVFGNAINYPSSSMVPDSDSIVIDDYDPAARMMQLYKPETSDIDRFRESIGDMPRRDKYTPNMTRGILGGIMALGGYERGQQYLDRPYNMALGEWENRMEPLQTAATLQHQGNVNARNAAQNIVSQEQADRRFQQTVRHQENQDKATRDRITEAEKRTKIAEGRAEIAREVAKGGVLEIDDAGTPRMRYRDGSYRIVDGEYLSAQEKADLIEKRQKAVAQAKPARVKEGYMPDPNDPTGTKFIKTVINLDTGEETPITSAQPKKPNAPLAPKDRPNREDAGDIDTRAKMVKSARSDWSKYIKMKNGRFEEIVRPGYFTGPSKEMYREIFVAIYQREPTEIDMSAKPETSATKPTTTGKVKVRRKSDGVTGEMDANDPALNSGKYEVIK